MPSPGRGDKPLAQFDLSQELQLLSDEIDAALEAEPNPGQLEELALRCDDCVWGMPCQPELRSALAEAAKVLFQRASEAMETWSDSALLRGMEAPLPSVSEPEARAETEAFRQACQRVLNARRRGEPQEACA